MKSQGYSLIELMVVVAIMGIIAAVAYPSYRGYMSDTYQAQAMADLKLCALALDRYYSNDFSYTGADDDGVCDPLYSPSDGPVTNKKFDLELTVTPNNYVIKVVPIGEGQCVQLSADGTQTSC